MLNSCRKAWKMFLESTATYHDWKWSCICVTGILRRTVVYNWCFDNLCWSHLQKSRLSSEDGFRTGCQNISRKQQSFLGLQLFRRSFSIKVCYFCRPVQKGVWQVRPQPSQAAEVHFFVDQLCLKKVHFEVQKCEYPLLKAPYQLLVFISYCPQNLSNSVSDNVIFKRASHPTPLEACTSGNRLVHLLVGSHPPPKKTCLWARPT